MDVKPPLRVLARALVLGVVATGASLLPAIADAQADVTLTIDGCAGVDQVQFDAALTLELRGVDAAGRAWAGAFAVSATLSCGATGAVLQLYAHGDACGAPAQLGDEARTGRGFPRLVALTVVELLEACREWSADATARDPAPPSDADADAVQTEEPTAAPVLAVPAVNGTLEAVELATAAAREPAHELRAPVLLAHALPRWTASASVGLLYAGRSQWAQTLGELELRFMPHRALSVSLGTFVGGGRTTADLADVRSRLVTLQWLVSGHLHTRHASLELGGGYLGALSFFTGTPPAGSLLAGVRAVVPWSGPVLRVEAAWRRGPLRVPVRVYVGWTLPKTRLLVGGVAALEWSGPFVVGTVGLSWGP